jgi:hypothetical protein
MIRITGVVKAYAEPYVSQGEFGETIETVSFDLFDSTIHKADDKYLPRVNARGENIDKLKAAHKSGTPVELVVVSKGRLRKDGKPFATLNVLKVL